MSASFVDHAPLSTAAHPRALTLFPVCPPPLQSSLESADAFRFNVRQGLGLNPRPFPALSTGSSVVISSLWSCQLIYVEVAAFNVDWFLLVLSPMALVHS